MARSRRPTSMREFASRRIVAEHFELAGWEALLLGADTPEGRNQVRYGSAVITHMRKGAGEVFCAGTTEWCYALAQGHMQTEIITRNVLDRFLGHR